MSLRASTMAPALKRLSTKDLCLAQKLVPSLEEFTINIVGILILIINPQTLMNDSGLNLNFLELEIAQLEKKLATLLAEEIKEKNQNRDLEMQLKQLQQSLRESSHVTSKLRDHHRSHMEFLDKKIENHQNTLDKYKSLYQSLQGRSNCHLTSANMQYGSSCNEDALNCSYIKPNKQKNQDLKLSVGSLNSTITRKNDQPEGKREINVVCEMTCQNCNGVFKPYRYYSHINHCQAQKLGTSHISNSLLLD